MQQFGGFNATSRLWRLSITKCYSDSAPPSIQCLDFFGIPENLTPIESWAPAVATTAALGVSTIVALRVMPNSIFTVNKLGIVDVFRWSVGSKPERPPPVPVSPKSPSKDDGPRSPDASASRSDSFSTASPRAKKVSVGSLNRGAATQLATPCILVNEAASPENVARIPPPPPLTLLSHGRPLIFSANPHR